MIAAGAPEKNVVRACSFRDPVAGNGTIPSAVTIGGGVSKLYPPTKSIAVHAEPG